jgi:hypothetical protein
LFVNKCSVADHADSGLIALLQAKGYTVTVFQSGGPPDDLRAAAVGQDVAVLSESIGFGTVLEPVGDPVVQKFILRTRISRSPCDSAGQWSKCTRKTFPEFSMFETRAALMPQPLKFRRARLLLSVAGSSHCQWLTGQVSITRPMP